MRNEFGWNSGCHSFHFSWFHVIRNVFNRKLLHIYYPVAKAKIRKTNEKRQVVPLFFIACKCKVLWPKVEAMRHRLFMTSLNFSLNQMIRLNKWILLQFYRITSVIYELLQRVRFSIQKFWPSQMYHFLWNHCKLGYFISSGCDAFRMCIFKWTSVSMTNTHCYGMSCGMACTSVVGMKQKTDRWPEHKIVSSHLISYVGRLTDASTSNCPKNTWHATDCSTFASTLTCTADMHERHAYQKICVAKLC